MAKLSSGHIAQQAEFEDEAARCIGFMEELLEKAEKQRCAPGSGQELKKLLPSPYLLRHICPTMVQREHLRGEEAALLSSIPHVLRDLEMDTFVKHPKLSRISLAGEYLSAMLYGLEVECFHMLCLDKHGNMKENVLLNRGVYDTSIFSLRLLLEEIHRVQPECIILCHNHPGGNLRPSREDIECTAEAIYALTSEGVPLLDHIIVSGKNAVSLRSNGFIEEKFWLNQKRGHRMLENFLSEENIPDRMINRRAESYLFCKSDEEDGV